jgi:hypothetical protein
MKRLIFLTLCAVALVGVVPSQAACVEDLPDGGSLCAGGYGPYEACLWGQLGSVAYVDNCIDTNSDAYSDLYVYGHGESHFYDIWTESGEFGVYARVGEVCAYGYGDISEPDPDISTC